MMSRSNETAESSSKLEKVDAGPAAVSTMVAAVPTTITSKRRLLAGLTSCIWKR